MLKWDKDLNALVGPAGSLPIPPEDTITRKLLMLVEGECTGLGPAAAAEKYDYSRQRYFQLRTAFRSGGADALRNEKRGPKTHYRRTHQVVRQVIRHRFLDPDASPEVIAQMIRQNGCPISVTSVKRIIADYGLQKKTLRLPPRSTDPED